jgi:hypothetical protein
MSTLDLMVERGADRLEALSRKAAAKGGFAAKLADELADDAAFLRRLKPSLIRARAKGKAPANPAPEPAPRAPSEPRIPRTRRVRKARNRTSKGGPNPFLVAGIALAAGIMLAKVIDWRGHGHPRD